MMLNEIDDPIVYSLQRSEYEDESTLTDTATLPSQKEKEGKDSGVGQDSAGSSEQVNMKY